MSAMTPDAIADAIAAKVCAGMRDIIASIVSGDALVTTEELAVKLRVSRASVKRYVKDGMPVVRLSERCPRFRLAECIAWREEHAAERRSQPKVAPVRLISRRK